MGVHKALLLAGRAQLSVKPEHGPGNWTGRVVTLPGRLLDPLHWKQPRRIFANSMSAALTQYRVALANGNENAGPEENANTETAGGTVVDVRQVVENSQTVFYFMIAGDAHIYRATLLSNGSDAQNLELPFIHDGAKVRFTYLNIGTGLRDVGNYDDLGLNVGSGG